MPRFGVVVFPGSNCDHDCYYVIKKFPYRRTANISGTRKQIWRASTVW